jgi:hypothetical protein
VQDFAGYQGFSQLFSGFNVNTLDSTAGDIHLLGTLFLSEAL